MTSEVRRIGGLRPSAEVAGPLAGHAAAFKQMLIEQGYARGTISAHLGLMSRVSRWLDVQGLPARALADLGEVDRFFAERRAKGCRLRITARSLVPLLDFLRDRQVIGAPVVPAATPAEVLLAEYRTYLEQERAATAGTVVNFTKYAGIFLRTFPRLGTGAAQQADLAAALGRLTAAEVVTFVTGWASSRSPAYGQAMVYALRNLLRYLHARGLLSHALAEAVPTVPGWKPARPVRAVTGQQMAALLACCDRHSAIGRRDYAIVLLLTRLGLRASEVAGITLAGIDWRQGCCGSAGRAASWPSFRCRPMSVRRWPTTCAAAVSVATARTCSCGPKHRSPAWRGPGSPRWCSALAGGRVCPRSGRTGSATPWPRSCDARAPR